MSAHVRLSGEIDVATIDRATAALRAAVQEHPGDTVVVDLREVSFLDSSGVGALIATLKLAQASGGGLRLQGAQPQVRKVFELTGLTKVIELED